MSEETPKKENPFSILSVLVIDDNATVRTSVITVRTCYLEGRRVKVSSEGSDCRRA